MPKSPTIDGVRPQAIACDSHGELTVRQAVQVESSVSNWPGC